MTLFETEYDYKRFEEVLEQALEKYPAVTLLAYCVMPNHFHLLVLPIESNELQKFMHWLTMTHTQRWHVDHKTTGAGHIYQGRYKSFLIEKSNYLNAVIRYIERNPLRAKLVKKGDAWKWSSLYRRIHGTPQQQRIFASLPPDVPTNLDKYLVWITEPQTQTELESLRQSVNKCQPYGSDHWKITMTEQFKLQSTMRSRGRPKNGS
jgi:putative transposase